MRAWCVLPCGVVWGVALAVSMAAAAGIPVLASDACGLEGHPGVTTLPSLHLEAWLQAVRAAVEADGLRT